MKSRFALGQFGGDAAELDGSTYQRLAPFAPPVPTLHDNHGKDARCSRRTRLNHIYFVHSPHQPCVGHILRRLISRNSNLRYT